MSHSFIHYIVPFSLLINITRTADITLCKYSYNKTRQDSSEIILFTNLHGVNPDAKHQDPISHDVFLKLAGQYFLLYSKLSEEVREKELCLTDGGQQQSNQLTSFAG